MLWAVAMVMVILWLLGSVGGYAAGNVIHILLFVAIIAMLVQIRDECSDYDSGPMRKRYLRRQLLERSGKILPKLATLSGEKVPRTIILPQTYREE